MKNGIRAVLSAVCLFLFSFQAAWGQEYEALMGVKSAKAVFDVRIGNPQSAAVQLKLMHQTYKDLAAMKKKPEFRIVFLGPSVRLISRNRGDFTLDNLKYLDEIASGISQMSKDGIKFEVCLVAAKMLKVDPPSFLPEIRQVENGWVSLIGYQARDFSLIPAY